MAPSTTNQSKKLTDKQASINDLYNRLGRVEYELSSLAIYIDNLQSEKLQILNKIENYEKV